MNNYFDTTNLKNIFQKNKDKLSSSNSIGIDGVSCSNFMKSIDDELQLIDRKVNNGTYNFSNYKQKLLIKDENKTRTISIPTQRDKFVLKILHDILKDIYSIKTIMAKEYINDIEENICNFDNYIKVDVTNFFPSVDHKILLDTLSQKLPDDIVRLIEQAITQATIDISKRRKDRDININRVGLPQGLPISGILADIYMQELDKKYQKRNTIKYYRYVDDILILCTKYNVKKLEKSINKDMKNIGLTIHPFGENIDKSFSGEIKNEFQYLGYILSDKKLSVRESTVDKYISNINKLFSHYKSTNDLKKLYKLLNLKITGCIYNGVHYGWIGYFSNINDMTLLFKLDAHIKYMCDKNDIEYDGKVKKISRVYYEIKKKESNYIPNYNCIKVEAIDFKFILEDLKDLYIY